MFSVNTKIKLEINNGNIRHTSPNTWKPNNTPLNVHGSKKVYQEKINQETNMHTDIEINKMKIEHLKRVGCN